MKKILLALSMSLVVCSFANADQASQPLMMDPVCTAAMEHMRASHAQVEAAIKANDATTVGTLIIADHKYMASFVAKNPQCKRHHPMQPMWNNTPPAANATAN